MEADQIEYRLQSIESRLAKIESRLDPAVPPSPVSATYEFNDEPILGDAPQAARDAAEKDVDIKPGNWLGAVAVICFIMAAGFIIKLSIDTGWLTPLRQLGLAAMFGFSLIGAGVAMLRTDREYASYLPGAGIVVLYAVVFAAHRYYELISFEAAMGLSVAVSGFCIALHAKFKHDIYPVTAAIGAYLAPTLLGLHAEAVFSIYYFILCSIAFATISVFLESRTLMLVASYLAIAMTGWLGLDLDKNALIASVLPIHFVIFAINNYIYTHQSRKPLTEVEAWGFMPVLLLFYAMEYYLIDSLHSGYAPWASIGFAAFLIALYACAKRTMAVSLASRPVIIAYATIVGFHSVYLELLPPEIRPYLLALILIAGAFAPAGLGKQKLEDMFFPMLALATIVVIEYLTIIYRLIAEPTSQWLLVAFIALAAIWVVIIRCLKVLQEETGIPLLLGAAHLLAIVSFYCLAAQIGSLAVSVSWLFYAVAVMVVAFICQNKMMAKSAVSVLGFAAGKALLFDAASAPTIVRIGCLALTGAVLYGCGLFMRKIKDWDEGSPV